MTTQGPGQALYKQCRHRDAGPKNQCRKKTEKEQLDIGGGPRKPESRRAGGKRGSEARSKSSKQRFLTERSTMHSEAEGFNMSSWLSHKRHFKVALISLNFSVTISAA